MREMLIRTAVGAVCLLVTGGIASLFVWLLERWPWLVWAPMAIGFAALAYLLGATIRS